MWTERHLEQEKPVLWSPLDAVDPHISTGLSFIPCTIHGSNVGQSASIDYEQLERILDSAADVYISKCYNAPFGELSIHLFKGNRNDLAKNYKSRRPHLITFLNGSKKDKNKLMEENPILFKYFTEIWKLRDRHMGKGLPNHYIFQLIQCYEEECIHPVCKRGKPEKEPVWYDGGPPLSHLPIPIPDPKRRWGQACNACIGFCTGHYIKPDDHMEHVAKYGTDKCMFSTKRSSGNSSKVKVPEKKSRQSTTIYARQFCLLMMFIFR